MSSKRCEARARDLTAWYRRHARDLPWRRTREPYAVWISEVMLQQTQVATVLPRFAAWLARFPDIATLAQAAPDAVLKAWEGLGYYRRARLLHEAARRIMAGHGGRFPEDFDAILGLPGIGRSTAGAIASVCFGQATPVLDGNVRRVLARWHGLPDAKDAALWRLAEAAIMHAPEPGEWNQAMMELGATVCLPRAPGCAACPVARHCASARMPAEAMPTGRASRPARMRDMHWRVALHLCPERGIWLVQRPASGIWAGLWAPPIVELEAPPARRPDHVHLLSHRRLHLYGEPQAGEPAGSGRWFGALDAVALPTGIHRLLAALPQTRGLRP